MNTPNKAVEATSSAQNLDKAPENTKAADANQTKGVDDKPEVTKPAPTSVK